MRADVETAVRDAVYVAVPSPPLDAIVARAARHGERAGSLRAAIAALTAAVSIAGLAYVFHDARAVQMRAPAPIASTTPAPAVT